MSGATKLGRIPCEGIGCRRTASEEKYGKGTRIVCRDCWRLAPRTKRIESARLERGLKILNEKLNGKYDAGTLLPSDPMIAEFEDLEKVARGLWAEIIASIQEARTGI